MPGVRVIPAYEPRGVYAASAALAMLLAAAQTAIMQIPAVSRLRSDPVPELVVTLAPPVAFVLLFASVCQRWRPALLTALLFGFTHHLTLVVTGSLAESSDRGSSLLTNQLWAVLIVSAAAGTITAIAAAITRWIARTFVVTLVEQTGRLCTHCGYTIDPPSLPLCPECGAPPDPGRLRFPRLFAALAEARRVGRPVLAVLVTLLLVPGSLVIGIQGRKFIRFQEAVSGGGELFSPAGFMEWTGPDGSARTRWVTGAWRASTSNPTLGITVAYDHDAGPAEPIMQIWAANRTAMGAGTFSLVTLPVVCTLDREQARHVLEHGVPDALLEAIVTAATSTGNRIAGRTVIDPAPYFPE